MSTVASGPSAPLRVNPSRLRVNEWGEMKIEERIRSLRCGGMTDGERKLETRRQMGAVVNGEKEIRREKQIPPAAVGMTDGGERSEGKLETRRQIPERRKAKLEIRN